MLKKSKGTIAFIIFFILALVIFLASFYFTRNYSLVPISGSSMENTFSDGDVVLCKNKAEINRGDVVIISGEGVRNTADGEQPYLLIKRVIALAGDTVKFSDGNLYLKTSGETEFILQVENYIKEQNSTFYPDATDYTNTDESGEILIGENQVFYLGDNRKVSHDSRAEDFGTCTREQIVGVVSQKMIERKESTKKYYEFTRKVLSFFNKGENS